LEVKILFGSTFFFVDFVFFGGSLDFVWKFGFVGEVAWVCFLRPVGFLGSGILYGSGWICFGKFVFLGGAVRWGRAVRILFEVCCLVRFGVMLLALAWLLVSVVLADLVARLWQRSWSRSRPW
jgi:hypothetical protein